MESQSEQVNEIQVLKQQLTVVLNQYETIISQLKIPQQTQEINQTLDHLKELIKKAASNEFHIGVIGSFNVGKSTFLNALLKRQLLSTNILPETASLTLLKELAENQSKEQARVHFFSDDEWQKKKNQSSQNQSQKEHQQKLDDLQKQTLDFKNWIQTPNKILQCDLTDLPKYTAATTADSKAIFVKEVEVLINSPFTKDQIVLIDTPGLDDPDQIRSSITENKMKSLDLLIMLFPSQQIFTQKDKEFIKKQIYHHSMHKTFFIINKIDQLNEPEEEVGLIKNFLDSEISKIFDEVSKEKPEIEIPRKNEIFAVSSYQAFLHHMKKKARWTLDETNMLSFENRLKSFLFQGEKAKELIYKLKANREGILMSRLLQVNDHIEILEKGVAHAIEKIDAVKKEHEEVVKAFEKSKFYIENRTKNFENHFYQKLEFLKQDIKKIENLLQSKAFDLFENFMSKHSGKSAAKKISSWSKSKLVPDLFELLKTEIENQIANFNYEIKINLEAQLDHINEYFQELKLNLEDMNLIDIKIQKYRFKVPNHDHGILSDIFSILKTIIFGNILDYFFGEQDDQDEQIELEIRKKMQVEIPNLVRELLEKTEKQLIQEIDQKKINFIENIYTQSQKPILAKQDELNQKEASFKQIISKLSQDEAQQDLFKKDLEIEKKFLQQQLGI